MISCVIVAENAKKIRDCIRTLRFCLDAVLYCKNDLDDKESFHGMSNIGCSTQTYDDKRILGTSQPIN
jgi:hypothetical protein